MHRHEYADTPKDFPKDFIDVKHGSDYRNDVTPATQPVDVEPAKGEPYLHRRAI